MIWGYPYFRKPPSSVVRNYGVLDGQLWRPFFFMVLEKPRSVWRSGSTTNRPQLLGKCPKEVLSDVHSFVADIPRLHPRFKKKCRNPLLFGSKKGFQLRLNHPNERKSSTLSRILYRYPRQCTAWFQPCCSQYMWLGQCLEVQETNQYVKHTKGQQCQSPIF